MDGCIIYDDNVLDNIPVIASVGFFSSALSILGTVSIIGFILWKRLYFQKEIRPLLHLTIADFLLSLLWISSTISYLTSEFKIQNQTHANICFVWQLLTELIHLITFLLTVNYSVNVYLQMKKKIERVHLIHDSDANLMETTHEQKIKDFLYLTSWMLPWILLIPIFVKIKPKNISPCQKCVLLIDVPRLKGNATEIQRQYGYIILATTLFFSIVSISVLYCMTLKIYWKAVPGFRTDRERRIFSNMQKRVTLYMISFLICWTPALIISCTKWNELRKNTDDSKNDLKHLYVLYLLQAILAPLQGFLNSLVYGWTRKSFRNAASPSDNHRNPNFATPYYDHLPSVTSYDNNPGADSSMEESGRYTPLAL